MLPTNIAKAKVFNIQDSLSIEKKSSKIAKNDETKEKLFKITTPRTMPLKSDKSTFLVYSAKTIASIDGIRESADSSMLIQSKFYR